MRVHDGGMPVLLTQLRAVVAVIAAALTVACGAAGSSPS
jgi:hypothetical protein